MSKLTPAQHLAAIAADNSKLFKEDYIRRLAEQGNDVFFAGCRLALDGFDTFGVKKVPVRNQAPGTGLTWTAFFSLAEQLIQRELTGHDAAYNIEWAMKQSNDEEWNGWYRRILMKDLKAGFSESTLNKAVKKVAPHYQIEVFSCQLAEDSKDRDDLLVGKKFIDTKFDGARCLTFVYPDGRVIQTSRNGKELENFPHVREQFAKIAKHMPEPWVFDGEMMSASFQELMKQFKRKTNVQTQDAIYHVFDHLSLAEFKAGKSKLDQGTRLKGLDAWYEIVADDMPNVEVVGYELVDLDTVEGQKRFRAINEAAIKAKYEGIMLKNPKGFYQTKRTADWLKKKPVISLTMKVTDVEEGKDDSKYKGMLGALVGEVEDQGRLVVANVGSGFSDEQRAQYWKLRKQIPGMLMEVEADAITQNQNGEYSLRFPRFKNFRGFKKGQLI